MDRRPVPHTTHEPDGPVLGTTSWAPDLLRYAAGAALGGVLCRAAAARTDAAVARAVTDRA